MNEEKKNVPTTVIFSLQVVFLTEQTFSLTLPEFVVIFYVIGKKI